ncbi:MAG: tetratricopeptide repeat protein [Bryobacteraceae bacterium]|nr:tetratricopeptide repeat protein [Bryobacteraceae bacterium]MDW8379419.1 tetratricopeptide repeat protein [Bryobacterales bacterium]
MFFSRRIGLCFVAWVWFSLLFAQDFQKRFRISGEVISDHGRIPDGLIVEVYDSFSHLPIEKVPLAGQGLFELNNLTVNQVEIRLVSRDGVVLRSEHVNLVNSYAPVRLRLPSFGVPPVTQETVSVNRLKHVPPKSARKLFQQSLKAQARGNGEKALELLQAAVKEDPLYLEAWNNLGTRYMREGKVELALEALRRAQAIDGDHPHVLTNLGIVLMHLKRRDEAEAVARRALRHARQDSKAEYILGLCLVHQPEKREEAVFYLRKAQEEFPQARLSIAQILTRSGKFVEARRELERYLTVSSQQKEFVEKWLAALPDGPAAK